MNEHDLLHAIGELPEETVKKYALPKAENLDAQAAGKERITMERMGEKAKKPMRIHMGAAAAVVALCLGLNAAIFYGIAKMTKTPGMEPGMAMNEVIDRDKVYMEVERAMPTGVGVTYYNTSEETYALPKSAAVFQEHEQVAAAELHYWTDTPTEISDPTELPPKEDAPVYPAHQTYCFDAQLPAGTYTLMTYGEDGETLSAFGSVNFEVSEEFSDMLWLPDVTGQKLAEAEEILSGYGMEDYNIKLDIQYAVSHDEGVEKDDVLYCWNIYETVDAPDGGQMQIAMNDGKGFWIRRGDIYKLTVCSGTNGDTIILPDVTNWDFETAKATILGLGMYVDKRSSYDAEVPAGKVISTDPEAPAELKTDSYVRVTVSLGPCPETFPVPNFTGMDVDEALEVARSLGLVLSISETTYDEPSGTIVSQNIEAGEEVSADTVIGVTVALAKKETVVRMQFDVPDDAAGHYHIGVYQDGILRAVGSTFAPAVERGLAYPEPAGGTTSVVIELAANETAEVTAILVNEDNGMEATIGTYRVSGETKSCEPLNANISAAFEAVQ